MPVNLRFDRDRKGTTRGTVDFYVKPTIMGFSSSMTNISNENPSNDGSMLVSVHTPTKVSAQLMTGMRACSDIVGDLRKLLTIYGSLFFCPKWDSRSVISAEAGNLFAGKLGSLTDIKYSPIHRGDLVHNAPYIAEMMAPKIWTFQKRCDAKDRYTKILGERSLSSGYYNSVIPTSKYGVGGGASEFIKKSWMGFLGTIAAIGPNVTPDNLDWIDEFVPGNLKSFANSVVITFRFKPYDSSLRFYLAAKLTKAPGTEPAILRLVNRTSSETETYSHVASELFAHNAVNPDGISQTAGGTKDHFAGVWIDPEGKTLIPNRTVASQIKIETYLMVGKEWAAWEPTHAMAAEIEINGKLGDKNDFVPEGYVIKPDKKEEKEKTPTPRRKKAATA